MFQGTLAREFLDPTQIPSWPSGTSAFPQTFLRTLVSHSPRNTYPEQNTGITVEHWKHNGLGFRILEHMDDGILLWCLCLDILPMFHCHPCVLQ